MREISSLHRAFPCEQLSTVLPDDHTTLEPPALVINNEGAGSTSEGPRIPININHGIISQPTPFSSISSEPENRLPTPPIDLYSYESKFKRVNGYHGPCVSRGQGNTPPPSLIGTATPLPPTNPKNSCCECVIS